nr:replication initiator protein A [uncultured Oscillibacter sp.]
METNTRFDYYYGDESNQFSFFRIPRQLITDTKYKGLSTDAKLLYGLMLNRMGLSQRNGWYDEQGRVFIYYPVAKIQEVLGCGHDKAGRLAAELERGYGLIERVRQGQGRPARIYVKRFTTGNAAPSAREPEDGGPARRQDRGKPAGQTAAFPQPRVRKNRSLDRTKPDANYMKKNYTEFSYINQSINQPEEQPQSGGKDECPMQAERAGRASRQFTDKTGASQIGIQFQEKPRAGSVEAKPERTVMLSMPLSAPAWNLIAQIPLVRGSSP